MIPGTQQPRTFTRRQLLAGVGGLGVASLGVVGVGWTWACSQNMLAAADHLPQEAFWVLQAPQDETGESPVVSAVALHPSGRFLASAGDDHRVQIWHLDTKQLVGNLDGHADWVRALAFSPGGTTLATAGNDRRVILWDVASLNAASESWTPDDPRSASGKVAGNIGSAIRQTRLDEFPEAVTRMEFAHRAGWLAVCGFQPKMYLCEVSDSNAADGVAAPREIDAPCHDVRSLAFAPNDTLFASAGRNGLICVRSLPSGSVRHTWQGHSRRIRGLAFSPDGTRLVSCGDDHNVSVWSVFDWTRETELATPSSKNFAVTFLSANQIATAGSDNRIRIWDLNSRRPITVLTGHTGTIASLDARGDILVSGAYDTTIRVWKLNAPVTVSRKGVNQR